MRIGIMLRALDEKGGIAVYTHNLVHELLRLDGENEYALFFRTPAHLGEFAGYANARELLVAGAPKAIWDQVAIPLACKREQIDVVFHPKFTMPLLAPCKAVMVVHGADHFFPEQARYYHPLDVRYARTMMPLYLRKAAAVISVSELTTANFYQVFDLPPGKIQTVYFAPGRQFQRVTDEQALQQARARYHLPDKFILTLTKPKGGGRKNLGQILAAYALYHRQVASPHKLVIGGHGPHGHGPHGHGQRYRQEYGIPGADYGQDILFPGWIDQRDLPAVYSLAALFLYPSRLEAFPIPLTEAMACGTPVITSDANGLREIAGGAALLVDPDDPAGIAAAIGRVLADPALQAELSAKGLARAADFSWEDCARKTLALLRGVVANGRAACSRGS